MNLFPPTRLTLLLCGILVTAGPALAADAAKDQPTSANTEAARVATVRNHDAAFALLIQSFQQLQAAMIEGDYQQQLFAADQVESEPARQKIRNWARQHRALRLTKLEQRLEDMAATYATARQEYEREAGTRVPLQSDPAAVIDRLNELVAFVPKSSPRREFVTTRIVPSQLVGGR